MSPPVKTYCLKKFLILLHLTGAGRRRRRNAFCYSKTRRYFYKKTAGRTSAHSLKNILILLHPRIDYVNNNRLRKGFILFIKSTQATCSRTGSGGFQAAQNCYFLHNIFLQKITCRHCKPCCSFDFIIIEEGWQVSSLYNVTRRKYNLSAFEKSVNCYVFPIFSAA